MQNHQRENDQAEDARNAGPAQRRDENRVAAHLRQLNRDPQRYPKKMGDRNKQGIRAWPNERGPAVGRPPIPVFRRADVPERVVLGRAAVRFLSLDDPELEETYQQQPNKQAVTIPKISHRRGAALFLGRTKMFSFTADSMECVRG